MVMRLVGEETALCLKNRDRRRLLGSPEAGGASGFADVLKPKVGARRLALPLDATGACLITYCDNLISSSASNDALVFRARNLRDCQVADCDTLRELYWWALRRGISYIALLLGAPASHRRNWRRRRRGQRTRCLANLRT